VVGPSSSAAARVAGVSPRCWAVAVALIVFAGAAALGFLHAQHDPALPMPAAKAIALGAHDKRIAKSARTATATKVLYIDDRTVSVTWFRHGKAIATTTVHTDGRVFHPAVYPKASAGYGAPLSHDFLVLGGLAVAFLLATLRAPLLRWRTLDALAVTAFLVPTILLDRALLAAGEATGAALLVYLLVRGIAVGVRAPRDDDPDRDAPLVLERLAARWRTPALGAQLAGLLLVAGTLVTLTSTGVVDVAIANMEGATLLNHGVLPYGHMPGDVVHGDTYGLPIYLLYAPFAALWPVTTDWDDAFGSLLVAALATLACAAGIARATSTPRWPAIVALLAFPAALMSASSGTNDGLIAAALVWAFAWWTRPAAATALLAGAGVAKLAPLVLLPLWLARLRGAALLRALAAAAAVALATLLALVAFGGLHAPLDMTHAMSFQASRRSMMSLWTTLDLQPLQPLAQAVTLAVALGGAALVALDRELARDPRRVAGLVTAVLAALQLQANHWAPLYLLWLAPPAMVALLGDQVCPALSRGIVRSNRSLEEETIDDGEDPLVVPAARVALRGAPVSAALREA
jgi:hypothetical protein